MTTSGAFEQRNPYKGSPPRPWVRVRLTTPAGSDVEFDLLADTGNPCGLVIGRARMMQVKQANAPDIMTNFGVLEGAWFELALPELGLVQPMLGYASDTVAAAARTSHPDLEGLAGLPFLRLTEYGGNHDWFWLRVLGP